MMMNNPAVLEASRVLAARLLAENSEIKDKIIKAFRLIVCRKPKDNEIRMLHDYYENELQMLTGKSAADLLDVGEYPLPENMDRVTLAAMMLVVNTIYNLEEVITKS
jgi:hypothetical protein